VARSRRRGGRRRRQSVDWITNIAAWSGDTATATTLTGPDQVIIALAMTPFESSPDDYLLRPHSYLSTMRVRGFWGHSDFRDADGTIRDGTLFARITLWPRNMDDGALVPQPDYSLLDPYDANDAFLWADVSAGLAAVTGSTITSVQSQYWYPIDVQVKRRIPPNMALVFVAETSATNYMGRNGAATATVKVGIQARTLVKAARG